MRGRHGRLLSILFTTLLLGRAIAESLEQEAAPEPRAVVTFNCTVAYMSQCMSCDKCRASCRSMGANSIRWFHDGCCECVGDKCLFYGINESRHMVTCISADGQGKWIATGDTGPENVVIIWDSEDAFPQRTIFNPHRNLKLAKLALSADSKYLLTLAYQKDSAELYW